MSARRRRRPTVRVVPRGAWARVRGAVAAVGRSPCVAGDRASGWERPRVWAARGGVTAAGRRGRLGVGAVLGGLVAVDPRSKSRGRCSFLTGLGDWRVGGVLVEAHRDL